MQDTALTVNQVLLDRTDNMSFRVLWLSPDQGEAYWIPLTGKRHTPVSLPVAVVAEGLSSGRYALVLDPFIRTDLQPSATAIRQRDQAWKLISDIVSNEPAIYRLHERSALLKDLSKESGVQIPNLYKLLTRYWTGGMTPNALLPRYENCGKGSNPYDGKSQRRGRKKTAGAEGKTLTQEDLRHFSDAILTWYHGKEQLTLDKTFQNMLGKWYVAKDENGESVPLDPDQVPSRSQFLYWHSKNRNILEEAKARNGGRNYPLQSRASIEKTESFLSGPCDSAQIDATVADIFLVSQNDRSKIVGRPTMYFLMDSYTRMVMGMHITLESPSWQAATLCILNAMEDKVEFCAKYGVQISTEDWPCHHIPRALVGDRGEMESVSADLLVNQLNMRIENTPPYRGDLKAIVEKHFHLTHVDMAALPGKMGKDYGERCTEDYRLGARLTLNEFISIIIHLVLLYNNYHYMELYGKTMQMRQMSIKPIPREIWNFGMKYLSGAQRTLSKAVVRYALLPSAKASITVNGILFRGLYYGCDRGFAEHWFDSARIDGRESISIAYDPRDGSHIYYKPSAESEPLECYLLDSNKITGQFSTEELAQMHQAEHAEREAYRATEDFQRILTNRKIQDIVDKAEKAFPKKPGSKHQRVTSIGKNRQEEIEAQYQQSAQKKEESAGTISSSSDASDSPQAPAKSRTQLMLEKALEENY